MEDPFPAAPGVLAAWTAPLAAALNLPTLPLHAHEIAAAVALYSVVLRLSPRVSTWALPRAYPRLPARARLNWDVHVVSLVQSVLITTLALGIMWTDHGARAAMGPTERVWAYTGAGGLIQGLATGYFLWDLIVTAAHVEVFGVGMLAHAVSALTVYALGFRPFVNFYAPSFVLYELSSPFLNIHWFLDKVNMTGSRAQWYNGIVLIGTFFGCRLVWGTYASVCVFRDIFAARHLTVLPIPPASRTLPPATVAEALAATARGDSLGFARLAGNSPAVPLWMAGTYLAANLTLNALNWFWFARMIETVRKRFREPTEDAAALAARTQRETAKEEGAATGRARSPSEPVLELAESVRRRIMTGEIAPPDEEDELAAL